MTPIAHGIDLVEIDRIAGMLTEHPQRFVERCFTAGEQRAADGGTRRAEYFAGRFAAKEAILKALGTGLSGGVSWTDLEVARDPGGAPVIHLFGAAAARAAELGITRWLVSISHTRGSAVASVIALGSVGYTSPSPTGRPLQRGSEPGGSNTEHGAPP